MPNTTEVVTERVDMFGFEGFLEEVTTGNPFVYPNGLIQSQTTKMDGITTSASNRPHTYYAVFDGDTGSVGKSVNFHTASNSDKVKMFSNPKNNLYWIEGKLYQWRVRQRTVAGAGNGDWYSIDSQEAGNYPLLRFGSTVNKMAIQGARDSVISLLTGTDESGGSVYAVSNPNSFTVDGQLGAFQTPYDNSSGYEQQCYFLVCGTVPR